MRYAEKEAQIIREAGVVGFIYQGLSRQAKEQFVKMQMQMDGFMFERLDQIPEHLYHFTKRENLEGIDEKGAICRFMDSSVWFCTDLDSVRLQVKNTIANEGMSYLAQGGVVRKYEPFNPTDYVVLKIKPSYRNDSNLYCRFLSDVADAHIAQMGLNKAFVAKENEDIFVYRGDFKMGSYEVLEMSDVLQSHNQKISA